MPSNNNQPQPGEDGQTLDQQIFQKKVTDFEKELHELQKKHGIFIVPIIKYLPFGTLPSMVYTDEVTYKAQLQELGQMLRKEA